MMNNEAMHCLNVARQLFPDTRPPLRPTEVQRERDNAYVRMWLKSMKPYEHDDAVTGIERYKIRNTHHEKPSIDDFVAEIDRYVNEIRPAKPRTDVGTLEAAVRLSPTAGDMLISAAWLDMVNEIMRSGRGHDPAWIAERCEALAHEQPEIAGYWIAQAHKHRQEASRTQAPATPVSVDDSI
jgi:hypothetical protein